jgi:hypothetical protein
MTYTFKQTEAALARLHRVPDLALGAFRGRLTHFQRIGITPQAPGKGKKIPYEKIDIYKWAVALEFAEFGIDPTTIKLFLDANWRKIRQGLLDLDCSRDRFLFFHPRFQGGKFPRSMQQSGSNPSGVPYSIDTAVIADLSELDKMAPDETVRAEVKSRFGMINLSHLRCAIDDALAAVSA